MIDKLAFKRQSLGLDYSSNVYHQHGFHMLCLLEDMACGPNGNNNHVWKHDCNNMFKTLEQHSSCSTRYIFVGTEFVSTATGRKYSQSI